MDEPRILNTRTAVVDLAVVDERDGQVFAGNHRVLAARELGWPARAIFRA